MVAVFFIALNESFITFKPTKHLTIISFKHVKYFLQFLI